MNIETLMELIEIGKRNNSEATTVWMNRTNYDLLKDHSLITKNDQLLCQEVSGLQIKLLGLPDGKVLIG